MEFSYTYEDVHHIEAAWGVESRVDDGIVYIIFWVYGDTGRHRGRGRSFSVIVGIVILKIRQWLVSHNDIICVTYAACRRKKGATKGNV